MPLLVSKVLKFRGRESSQQQRQQARYATVQGNDTRSILVSNGKQGGSNHHSRNRQQQSAYIQLGEEIATVVSASTSGDEQEAEGASTQANPLFHHEHEERDNEGRRQHEYGGCYVSWEGNHISNNDGGDDDSSSYDDDPYGDVRAEMEEAARRAVAFSSPDATASAVADPGKQQQQQHQHEEITIPTLIAYTCYLGYAVLILLGQFRDFCALVFGGRWYKSRKDRPTGTPSVDDKDRYAPLLKNWEHFYTR